MMRYPRSNGRRLWTLALSALVALAVNGCGDDDNHHATSSYPGQYSAAATLDAGQTGTVNLAVAADGATTGTLEIANARVHRVAIPVSLIPLSGSTDLGSGHFELGGTFRDAGGQDVDVRVSGDLPTPTRSGTMTIQIGTQTFSGAFTPPPPTATRAPATATRTVPAVATATNVPGATLTRTPTATPTPTTTPTSGGSVPTNTPGVSNGVDSRMLGTFAGTAQNESTGVEKQVRIRLVQQGSEVAVTDLGGNLFKTSPSTVTMTAQTPTALTYTKTSNPLVAFNLTLVQDGEIAGIYSATTVAFPPVIDAVGLDLHREG